MKISPIDIHNQEFKKVMRGYDPVEVDTFLEMVGAEYEQIINLNKENEKKVMQLEAELKNFKEVEKTLKQTLMNVQETSNQSRENSKKEATLIKKEAEITATEMIEKAKRAVAKMREEVINLNTQKESLVARLRYILNSQLELLEVLEVDEADIAKLKDRTKKILPQTEKKNEKPLNTDRTDIEFLNTAFSEQETESKDEKSE